MVPSTFVSSVYYLHNQVVKTELPVCVFFFRMNLPRVWTLTLAASCGTSSSALSKTGDPLSSLHTGMCQYADTSASWWDVLTGTHSGNGWGVDEKEKEKKNTLMRWRTWWSWEDLIFSWDSAQVVWCSRLWSVTDTWWKQKEECVHVNAINKVLL